MSLVHAFDIPTVLWYDWAIIFAGLGLGVGVIFEILNFSAPKANKHRVFTLTNFWLVLSGVIHVWIEFNFTFYRSNSTIKPTLDMYAAADYRYGDYGGMMESGTTAMEAITAVLTGPMCFLTVFASVQNWGAHHPLQIILCTMQLYGLVWFTLQPVFSETGLEGHFSSDPTLFWLIAFGANAPWAVFPTILLAMSVYEVSKKMAQK